MKTSLLLSLLAGGAVALVAAGPLAVAHAQPDPAPMSSPEPMATPSHGDWTLKQREDWLRNRLDTSRDDGSLDHGEYDRVKHELGDIRADEDAMRDHHDGHQLTGNETLALETRLDGVSDKIHWLREGGYHRPW